MRFLTVAACQIGHRSLLLAGMFAIASILWHDGVMPSLEEIGSYIKEQRDAAEMSLRQLAKAAEVSNPYLSQVERGLRKPSAEVLSRIASGLRISAETLYVKAGILAERDGDEVVTTAIAADATLTERQRATLLQIYAAFQAENSAAHEVQADAGTDV